MATAKKSTAKKKPTAKKTISKKTQTTAAKHSMSRQLFRPAASETPFLTFRITRQTLYWLILSLAVLIFGLWVIKLQIQIQNIYDSIEANSSTIESIQASPRSPR